MPPRSRSRPRSPARSEPIRRGYQRDRPGLSGSCTPLRRPSRLRAVAEDAPQCRPPSCLGERSGSGSESWPNGGLSWPYLRLSRPPTRSDAPVQPASGWSAWATSGADRAKQRCFSPAATELRQTLKSAPRSALAKTCCLAQRRAATGTRESPDGRDGRSAWTVGRTTCASPAWPAQVSRQPPLTASTSVMPHRQRKTSARSPPA